jgi:hypothetical protein
MYRKLLAATFTVVFILIASALILKTTAYGATYSPAEGSAAQNNKPAPSAAGSQPDAPSAMGSQSEPAVAYNPTATEYLVVWQDNRGTGVNGAYNVYGQRVDADGTMLGTNFVIAEASSAQEKPKVAFSTDATGYLVVWEDTRADSAGDIYGQLVNSDGTLFEVNFPISKVPGSGEAFPDVAYSASSNEYLVVWSISVSNGNRDVKGLRLATDGTPQVGVINIIQTSSVEFVTAVSYNASTTQFLVVAESRVSFAFGTNNVHGQLVGSNGALSGQTFAIAADPNVLESDPDVAYNSTLHDWLVVWRDSRDASGDVYGRRIGSNGSLLGSDIAIAAADSTQERPSVAYSNAAQVYMVTWHDSRVQYADIYAQIVHNNGTLGGANFIVSNAAGVQSGPDIVDSGGPTYFFAVWTDNRDNDNDVFAQRISNDGQMLDANFPVAPYPYEPNTPTPTRTSTASPTAPPTATSTPCTIQYSDVPQGSPFYDYIRCLACRNVLSGYSGEANCPGGSPCFRPNDNITRGQIAKIVSNAAGYEDAIPGSQQSFADVPSSSPFWLYIERVHDHGAISGYECSGTNGEPASGACYRPGANLTRGQLAKIATSVAEFSETPSGQTFNDVPPGSPFYEYIERAVLHGIISGYPCGTAGHPEEPCPGSYFRPGVNVTRGQAAKIVAGTFFPNCITPARK